MESSHVEMPSDRFTPLVEIMHTGDIDELCIVGFSGNVCGGVFDAIERDFRDEKEFWTSQVKDGPGSYLFEAHFVPAQIDDMGRIELCEYWMLERLAFRKFESEE